MRNAPGYFITLEGPEGSGKTTQIRLITDWFQSQNIPYLQLREPGGTQIGDQFRQLVHDLKNENMSAKAEFCAYGGSRAQLVHEEIIPALNEGLVVICDRYIDSNLAYQGYGRGLGVQWLSEVNNWLTNGIQPDLTLLFDLPVDVGLERIHRSKDREFNRMDAQDIDLYHKVRYAYLTLATSDTLVNPTDWRWHIIDANQDEQLVFESSREIIGERLIHEGFLVPNSVESEMRVFRERE